ncbi:ScbA/BarX family gamma-butyrolactone biosynthesis protein [Streptomyces sp. NPDC017979]|uniref:ScbA/BarX family gamma-butyrolactone biosynthesis protein n=1 Tax=Streptomyces sp. NPDC017979 TaxID=3365024 RepID=UPI00379416B5
MSVTAVRRPDVTGATKLTTTVAKEHVHRAALAEVFLTGVLPNGQDRFTVTAQWPRGHSFFVTEHGRHDPLLLAETVRQTVPLLLHSEYGVPYGHQFGWVSFQLRMRPDAMRITSAPAELELHVTCRDVRRRGGLPVAMTQRTDVWRGQEFLGWAETRFWCHSPSLYRRLRGRFADRDAVFAAVPEPPPPVPGELVGRDRVQDVVLCPGDAPDRWRLRVDTAHPTLFDHPLDHVPGMLSLEAVRQAAVAARADEPAAFLAGLDISFDRYIEFEAPCWLDVRRVPASGVDAADGTAVEVRAVQSGQSAFLATAFFQGLGSV